MPLPSPSPEVPPEAVRTVEVACCRQCLIELRTRRRAIFCSGKCRVAWHRHMHEAERAARERDLHAQLAESRRREDEARAALDGIRHLTDAASPGIARRPARLECDRRSWAPAWSMSKGFTVQRCGPDRFVQPHGSIRLSLGA